MRSLKCWRLGGHNELLCPTQLSTFSQGSPQLVFISIFQWLTTLVWEKYSWDLTKATLLLPLKNNISKSMHCLNVFSRSSTLCSTVLLSSICTLPTTELTTNWLMWPSCWKALRDYWTKLCIWRSWGRVQDEGASWGPIERPARPLYAALPVTKIDVGVCRGKAGGLEKYSMEAKMEWYFHWPGAWGGLGGWKVADIFSSATLLYMLVCETRRLAGLLCWPRSWGYVKIKRPL